MLVACVLGVLFYGEEITLKSTGKTEVYSPYQGKSVERKIVAVIQPDQKVQVLGCESNKSDAEIEVRLSSGQAGFVIGGPYRLERRRISVASLTAPSLMVFSCRGMFAPISERV